LKKRQNNNREPPRTERAVEFTTNMRLRKSGNKVLLTEGSLSLSKRLSMRALLDKHLLFINFIPWSGGEKAYQLRVWRGLNGCTILFGISGSFDGRLDVALL
jgi:hypothetical protein